MFTVLLLLQWVELRNHKQVFLKAAITYSPIMHCNGLTKAIFSGLLYTRLMEKQISSHETVA